MKQIALAIVTVASIIIGWQVTKLVASLQAVGLGTAESIGAIVGFSLLFGAGLRSLSN
jgi:hypothetical protein